MLFLGCLLFSQPSRRHLQLLDGTAVDSLLQNDLRLLLLWLDSYSYSHSILELSPRCQQHSVLMAKRSLAHRHLEPENSNHSSLGCMQSHLDFPGLSRWLAQGASQEHIGYFDNVIQIYAHNHNAIDCFQTEMFEMYTIRAQTLNHDDVD
jgi:hypothetical protein